MPIADDRQRIVVEPDIETKSAPDLIAQLDPERAERLREEQASSDQERKATLPTVDNNGGRDEEVVYAVATRSAILMPDLRGRSVRDVARTCAQLGPLGEARRSCAWRRLAECLMSRSRLNELTLAEG